MGTEKKGFSFIQFIFWSPALSQKPVAIISFKVSKTVLLLVVKRCRKGSEAIYCKTENNIERVYINLLTKIVFSTNSFLMNPIFRSLKT